MPDTPHPEEQLVELEQLYTIRRRVLVVGLALLTVLNLAVAGLSARTLTLLGGAIEAGPEQTERVLLVIDCRRQADLEELAAQLDLVVQLVDPRCAQLEGALEVDGSETDAP